MKIYDLTGQKFGRWTVLEFSHVNEKHFSMWKCKCECGTIRVVCGINLVHNASKSYGCLQREISKRNKTKHGRLKHCGTEPRLYRIWKSMKARCRKEYVGRKNYEDYAGKGIEVCEEWANDYSIFEKWALENGYQEHLTIDRIDNSKNYSPDNCRWATYKEQANNTKRNRYLTYKGETHTFAEWAKIKGFAYRTLYDRINKSNWTIEEALTIPPGQKRR